jgi:hypothetical protein
MNTSKELATQEPNQPLGGLSLVEYRNNRQLLLQVMHQEMKPGVDYGITPGTNGKPSLWKPGAEKLVSMFAFAPSFAAECERHDDRHRTYTIKCTLKHRGTETFLGDADAVCSTLETKYVARNRTEQNPAGTPNNPADYYNTAMKMGGKRALIAAVLFVTGASDIFTQDVDDDEEHAKGGNGGANGHHGGASRGRGTNTPKAAAGLWTGTMAAVTAKSYKDKDGASQQYYILALADGRSASTFDSVIAEAARGAKDQVVKIGTKTGKKAGFFNVESFEVFGKEEPKKPEQKPELDPDLEPAADDIPF